MEKYGNLKMHLICFFDVPWEEKQMAIVLHGNVSWRDWQVRLSSVQHTVYKQISGNLNLQPRDKINNQEISLYCQAYNWLARKTRTLLISTIKIRLCCPMVHEQLKWSMFAQSKVCNIIDNSLTGLPYCEAISDKGIMLLLGPCKIFLVICNRAIIVIYDLSLIHIWRCRRRG